MAVKPERQGRGVGRKLIAFAERRAHELEFGEVELYKNEHMTENLALYSALGYVEVDRRSGEGFDRVFFRKTVR